MRNRSCKITWRRPDNRSVSCCSRHGLGALVGVAATDAGAAASAAAGERRVTEDISTLVKSANRVPEFTIRHIERVCGNCA